MKTNLVQSVMLPLSKIEANRGQIEGLPKNPRVIRDAKFEILKKSIQDDPEMTALREILVIEHNGKYVIIGGNMRFRAMQDLGIKEAPCKIIPADTDVEKLKAYTIKDNAGFGEWDWDDRANEWSDAPLSDWGDAQLSDWGDAPLSDWGDAPLSDWGDAPLSDWGVDVWEDNTSPEDYGTEFNLKEGDKEPFQQMTFTLADEQAEFIKSQLELSKQIGECETFGNTNTNGNALYNIVRLWAGARK